MLSKEKNEQLTRVGPGTPMGELLRRYWWPIATSSMLGERPIARRLLGEDLVLFRDKSGTLGLLEERCPHRRASLSMGCVEQNGLRCGYHGWVFSSDGKCIEQPPEPEHSTFKDRVTAVAYQAQELGGLIFAYMGPSPAPLVPRFDMFVWDNAWRDIGHCVVPANWMQIMENSIDPHHVEWLHGYYATRVNELLGKPGPQTFSKRHIKVAFDAFEFGIIKRRVLEGHTEENDDWKIGHPIVFPHMLRVGGGGVYSFQIRVPVDDTHTWHVWYQAYRPNDDGVVPPQKEIPVYEIPIYDAKGAIIDDYVDGQDIMAWMTQGAIADRTQEHLGTSDAGVIMLRRMFFENMDIVANGGDPIGTVRDPSRTCINLPQERDKFGASDVFRREWLQIGQTRYSPLKNSVVELFDGPAEPREPVLA
jgi:5,5'-dehydrodivanillate O-demethylase